jgi:hypothetical protein
LANPANTDGDLQWGQGAAGFGTKSQGAEGGETVSNFADCDGPDAVGWLGEGEEAGVLRKVASDPCLDESEHGGASLFAAAHGGLDVLIRPDAGSRSRPVGRDFRTLLRISPVTAAGRVSGVGTGWIGSGGCRACSAWHTSAVGSRMGWGS